MDKKQTEHEMRALIEGVLRNLPADYSSAVATLRRFRHVYHEAITTEMEQRLGAYAATVPQESLVEKRTLATQINAELREIGLAIKCPRTGQPAILVADLTNLSDTSRSRLRLESRDSRGHKIRTTISLCNDELQLIPDPPRRESLSKYKGM